MLKRKPLRPEEEEHNITRTSINDDIRNIEKKSVKSKKIKYTPIEKIRVSPTKPVEEHQ